MSIVLINADGKEEELYHRPWAVVGGQIHDSIVIDIEAGAVDRGDFMAVTAAIMMPGIQEMLNNQRPLTQLLRDGDTIRGINCTTVPFWRNQADALPVANQGALTQEMLEQVLDNLTRGTE